MLVGLLALTGGLFGYAGEAVAEAPRRARGGWVPTKEEIAAERRFRAEKKQREKRLEEEIELAYRRLVEGDTPREVVREAAKVAAPYVTKGTTPKRVLAEPARVDFAAMAQNVEAAERLLALYARKIEEEDEEAASLVLSIV